MALLATWLFSLILGYGLILFALRDELQPAPPDLGGTMYFAATSILTLGFGDIVATGALARIIVITAAVGGLGAVALVVTFLFSLYGSYQRREVRVVALQAAAGAPPSAVALLETYAQLELVERLPELFRDWERWAAEVLDTHVAYPLLGFFRSSHDNLSWISALGTVLDAASLVLTTIEGVPRGEAKLFKRVGTHLVEDISNLGFRAGEATEPGSCRLRGRLRPAPGGRLPAADGRRRVAIVRGVPRDLRPAPRGHGQVLGDAGHLVARGPGLAQAPAARNGGSVGAHTEAAIASAASVAWPRMRNLEASRAAHRRTGRRLAGPFDVRPDAPHEVVLLDLRERRPRRRRRRRSRGPRGTSRGTRSGRRSCGPAACELLLHLAPLLVEQRDGGDEHLRVRMERIAVDLLGGAHLDDLAAQQDQRSAGCCSSRATGRG